MRSDIARIFVSSTWLDLQPERRAVEDAINRMSAAKFIGMEYFGSRPESTEGASLDEVDAADLYLGIIAGRYGSGITEAEYRRAQERKLPCFIYFKDEAAAPAEWRETDPARTARLAAFKRELMARHIVTSPFKTSAELAIRVRDDLYRWFFTHHLSAQFARTSTGAIITSRDDQRVLRLDASSEFGGVIYNGEMQKPRPRPAPARPSVRPFRGLLDRVVETDAALTALHSLDPVEFYGQPGIGKTALLRHLAYRAPNGQFADGAVYLEGVEKQPTTDLLQFLFDSFYESEPGYKPREGELLNLLRDKRALILMDDVKLSRTEIERVMNAAPECAFLLSGPERHLFGEGRAMQMPGLPEKESLQLLERELGRMLEPEEQSAARAICSLLQGHPLHLAQAAALVGECPLAEIAVRLQASREQAQNPAEVLNWQIAAAHSDNEKRVLAALAALNGATVRAESLAVIAGQDDIGAAIDGMLQCKLIEAHGDGYRLNSSLQAMLQNEWELTPWRQRALDYFTAWAERHQQLPGDHKRIQEESAALLALFNWAVQTGRHREAIRLGRAVEGALILGGRWEAWGQVLQQIGQAAEASRDREAEAWVLHQQGTRAVCLGNDGAARELLTEALEMRAEMGDHAAASVTRHNLDWLFPPVPFEPPQPAEPNASDGSSGWVGATRPRTGWLLKFGGAALLAGLGGWLWWPEAKAQFAPGEARFSSQPLNQTSEEIAATLVNSTSKELAIDDVRIDGAAAADFKIVSEDCRGRRLARGENCSVRLFFQPQTQGAHQAVLRLIGSPGDLLPELKMTGATLPLPTPTPEPRSTPSLLSPTPVASPSNAASPAPAPGPRLEISPGSLTFPARQVKTSDTAQVTLINSGAADLKINDIWITGPYRRDFSVEQGSCRQKMIQPNGSCTVSLSFTPSDEGDRGATLIINSNAAASPLNVPVTGAGLRPTPTPTPTPRPTPTATPRPTPTATPRPTPINPARIYDFSAESLSIVEGKETRLCYSMGNVARASISPGVGNLENLSKYCISIRPKRTTAFTLTAFGSDGQQASRSVMVQVIAPPPPKPPMIYDFSADPSSIPEGNGTKLCYSMSNVARASISPSIGGLDNLGRSCVSINLKRTTTFTLTAFGGDGEPISRSVQVQVIPPPPLKPPVIYDFSTDPSSISEGKETRLCYSMGNVARASISPLIGNLDNLSRYCISIRPKRTTTFTLTAFGSDGQQTSRSVTVQVTPPPPQPKPPVIYDFSADPSSISEGKETRLCYSMGNVVRASISPSIGGLENLSRYCISIRPNRTMTFTLTAFGGDGQQTSRSITLQVIPPPQPKPPVIYDFSANPSNITEGNETRLCYSMGNVARASISPSIGGLDNLSKSCVSIGLKQTTAFTLTAFSGDGQQTSSRVAVQVIRRPPVQPPRIYEFFPRPAKIVEGNGAVLCYSIGAAARASISPEVGELRNLSKDCVKVSPKRTTTYTLFAGGSDNQYDKQSTTVEVQAPSQEQPPPEKKKKDKEKKPGNEQRETGEPDERKSDSKDKSKKEKDELKNKPKISIGFGISIGGSKPRTPRPTPTPTPTPGRNPGVLNRKP